MNKKLLIVTAFLAIATQTFAQTWGIKAGANFSDMVCKDDNTTYSDNYGHALGYHVGLTLNVPVKQMFSFETAFLFSTKGYEEHISYSSLSTKYDQTVTIYYLDIPLTGKASFDVGPVTLYGVLGPYLGVGLLGKYTTETTVLGVSTSSDGELAWGTEDENSLNRLDYGVTAGAGVEFNSVQVGFNYYYGVANASSYTTNGYTANHRVCEISLGYRFK